ncbi:hypothetical protein [Actinomadura alba]|uniref:DUF2637 domain-containing protein n=1 Tax=Actinomadura alba TaxID=406431 RepID=A0ABR7LKZ2_9ACTN|nr:hypothetical protein [Actinomadura alba]MBC6465147.1 hypothetical protein [Actinomadura alba]
MAPRTPAPMLLAIDPLQVIDQHPVPAALVAVAAVIALVPLLLLLRGTFRAAARPTRGISAENVFTVVAAGIATAVAAQGMWQFFGDILHFSGPLRVLTFAFIEVSVITSALRARASMRERHSAGVDGIAVWVLTCLSAVLSSLDARSFGETVLRLTAPLVAAWLWERGMALERMRITGRTRVNWRLTPERVLVRIGLADPTGRDIGEVDAQRRLMRLALAAKHARTVRDTGTRRAQRRALAKLDRAMERTVEYGGLGTDPARQDMLIAQLGVLYNAASLLDLEPEAPWAATPADGRSADDADAHPAEQRPVPVEPDTAPEVPQAMPHALVRDGAVQDTPAEPPPAAELRPAPAVVPGAKVATDTGELAALFLDALGRHEGSVPAARADMERAGRRPPSSGYAYKLRKRWHEQTAGTGRLTRVG